MTRPAIVILLLTILAMIGGITSHREPPHPRVDGVPYCVVDSPVAAKDPFGNWHYGWSEMYGPCSQQDRYVNA